jgi:hypothetical protein
MLDLHSRLYFTRESLENLYLDVDWPFGFAEFRCFFALKATAPTTATTNNNYDNYNQCLIA